MPYADPAKHKEQSARWYRQNTERAKAVRKAWAKAHPERLRLYGQRKRARRSGMRLRVVEYQTMLAKQGGGCAICGGKNNNRRRMPVDHDHQTGVVRGILCDNCNLGLGKFRDDSRLLRAAETYLRAA